ncbi:helix-turn-helix domain-containing protein [Streptomyces sp. NBC_00576]|uniref:helix-turn-helix domain-containing protein n=1 Tax=Streptomyces sp. NBC_00576 TaxID=2903665 RepID=UPI002E823AD0|nr:helix-turn-helix transcriptional regulator [Streptomyces sp. NBC_00576]WUB70043.1 helix-turn-helix transcriptional regulator [Streptomyces sp. NBC_00576]
MELLTARQLQTARDRQVLTNGEAATVLFLSRKTVEAHLARIYRKLDLRSRTDLPATWHGPGWSADADGPGIPPYSARDDRGV